MKLKVPFKAVPNFKKKTSWLAVGVCFGFASSLLTIALPLAFAQSNAENEDRTIERGNIAVTKSVQSSPLGGTSIVYAKTRLTDTQSASKNANISTSSTVLPKLADTKLETTTKVENSPVMLPAESFFTPAISIEPEQIKNDSFLHPKSIDINDIARQKEALISQINKNGNEKLPFNLKENLKNNDLGLTSEEVLLPQANSNFLSKKASNKKLPEDTIISKLEFNQANMLDVARALADISGMNFLATEAASKKNVTVFLQNITVKNALIAITKNTGVWYRQDKDSNTFRIMSTEEYQQDLIVYREDTTRIFNLLHPNPIIVATAIRDLYGDRVRLSLGEEDQTFMPTLTGGGGTLSSQSTTTISSSGSRSSNNSRSGSNSRRSSSTSVTNQNINYSNGNRNSNNDEPNTLRDDLTPTQLQKLGDRLAEQGDYYALSSDALKGINNKEQPIFITLNREHDLMIVRTSDNSVMQDIERLVKEMDRPTKQVLLEMKILSLDVGDAYRQAVDLDYMPSSKTLSGPITDQIKNPLGTIAPINVTNTTTVGGNTSTQSGVVRLGVSSILGLGNFALEGGTFVYQFLSDKIRARIQLMQENNRIQTLSAPLLLTSNNKPARVFVGTEQVLTTGFDAVAGGASVAGVGAPAIIPITEVRNIGNTLQVMPKINADKTVTLLIQQDSSTLLRGSSTIPIPVGNNIQSFNVDSVRTSNIQGTVVAKDGLTVAIGGLIDSSDSEEEQKVPVIGDFPIIGNFFKRKVQEQSKRELLLLITPHIIETPHLTDDVTRDTIEPLTNQEW